MCKWIKYNREAPPVEGSYIVYVPSADYEKPFIHEAWYNAKSKMWELIPFVWAKAVTHYMYKPNPPEC